MYSSNKKNKIVPMGLAWQNAQVQPVVGQHKDVPHIRPRPRRLDLSGGPQLTPAARKPMSPAPLPRITLPNLTNLVGKDRVAHDFADNTALKGRDAMSKVMAAMKSHHIALNGLPKAAFAASSGSSIGTAAVSNVVHFAPRSSRKISVGGPSIVGEIFSAATSPFRSPLAGTGLTRRLPYYAYPAYKPRWAA